MTEALHRCPSCRRDLPASAFCRHAGRRRETYCRACSLDRQRAYRATDAGRERARDAQRRSRARRSGLPREDEPASPAAA